MTTTAVTKAISPPSLVREFGEKYTVDPGKVLGLLRDTAFAPVKGQQFTDSEVQAALIIAKAHDLNPFLKEIYLARAGGKLLTIVPIDGWTNIANRHPQYDGCEFEDIVVDNKIVAIKCKIFRKDRSHATEVTEYLNECHRGTGPWNDFPARMLRHKAFIQACRYAFSLGGIYDPDEAERIAETTVEIKPPIVMDVKALPSVAKTEIPAEALDVEGPASVGPDGTVTSHAAGPPRTIADLVADATPVPAATPHTTMDESEFDGKLADREAAQAAHRERLKKQQAQRAERRMGKNRARQTMDAVPPVGGGSMVTGERVEEAPKKTVDPTAAAIFPKRTKDLKAMPRELLELWIDKLAQCYKANGNDPVARLHTLCPNGVGSLSDAGAVSLAECFETDLREVAPPF